MFKKIYSLFILGSLASTSLCATQTPYQTAAYCKHDLPFEADESGYARPKEISVETWDSLKPYFLPFDAPIRPILDEIFTRDNVLHSINRFKVAGFKVLTSRKHKIVVAKHPRLKGYVVKAYIDQSFTTEHGWWVKRILGADAIREKINEYGYEGIMKVPHKWIYPVTDYGCYSRGKYPKHFILIAEDMDILSSEENSSAYKHKMDESKLDALFHLITELHLSESVYIFNTPFARDGKLAFIDTEFALQESAAIDYRELGRGLNANMKLYWETLFENRNK